jgi:N-acetylglucosaminyldiphosphoundecaprenol N-acetyl-beta-D-mannosaminyltransferase
MSDPAVPPPVDVWGLPLAPVTLSQTLDLIDRWIAERTPRFLVTANVHYAMLAADDPRLADVNRGAAVVLADGMPLVWAARGRLPERVAGSDLVPALCRRAAERGYRMFLLGAAPGVAAAAAEVMVARHPGLNVVGAVAPPYRDLTAAEMEDLVAQVRSARPDLLVLAFAMPRGELWMAEHYQALGAPVTIQAGATLDFLAGRVPRAPRWLQRVGLEWAYRLWREPTRLASRYARNAQFIIRMLLGGSPKH